MSHTPGPWNVIEAYPLRIVADGDKLIVANVYRQFADANLIAAAPELLEACVYAADFLSQRTEGKVTVAERLGLIGGRYLKTLVDKAVAKAEGRTL